jgi:hypothetical protein
MSEFKREDRYITIKRKNLSADQAEWLNNFIEVCEIPIVASAVVEADWPEYEPVWKMIQDRIQGHPPTLRSDLVPGLMHCAKCKFQLQRRSLYMQSGTVGDGTSETEPCANGCGPLWPVTWKQYAEENAAIAERLHLELLAIKQTRPSQLDFSSPTSTPGTKVIYIKTVVPIDQDYKYITLSARVQGYACTYERLHPYVIIDGPIEQQKTGATWCVAQTYTVERLEKILVDYCDANRGSGLGEVIADLRLMLTTEHSREGIVSLPLEPQPGLLMSMALRLDHALGCPGHYDMPGESMHAQRQQVAIGDMRKVYEEVVGLGFYRPEKEDEYSGMVAVPTTTESGETK